MREVWRSTAIYLGFVKREGEGRIELVFVRQALLSASLMLLLAAAVCSVFAVVAFDWEASGMVGGGLLGLVVFGVIEYFGGVRHSVPGGLLLAPPRDAVLETPAHDRRVRLKRMVLLSPMFLALTWLADHWNLGAVFLPGQPLGFATARLVGAARVTRWERTHRSRVVANLNGDDPGDLYAVRLADTHSVHAATDVTEAAPWVSASREH